MTIIFVSLCTEVSLFIPFLYLCITQTTKISKSHPEDAKKTPKRRPFHISRTDCPRDFVQSSSKAENQCYIQIFNCMEKMRTKTIQNRQKDTNDKITRGSKFFFLFLTRSLAARLSFSVWFEAFEHWMIGQ